MVVRQFLPIFAPEAVSFKIKLLLHLSPPSKGHLGPSWSHPGPSRAHLGAILGPSWAILGPSWGYLGPSWGPSWTPLGPTWGHLVAILGHLGAILVLLLAILGPFCAILGLRAILKLCHLGAIWRRRDGYIYKNHLSELSSSIQELLSRLIAEYRFACHCTRF